MYKDWYALFVVTGEEERVKERLIYRFQDQFRIMVPKRKLRERKDGIWHYRTRVLFPGYVIMECSFDVHAYYYMKNIPGLIRMLRTGWEFTSMDKNEVMTLSKLISSGDEIGISTALTENGHVRVIEGPSCSL